MKSYFDFIEPDNLLQFRLVRLSTYLALAVCAIAVLVLAAWQWDIGFLKWPVTAAHTMNPLTAICFIFTSISFLLLFPYRSGGLSRVFSGKNRKITGRVLAAGLIVLGCLQAMSAKSVTIDGPAPMTLSAAVCFTLTGVSLLLLNTQTKARWMPAHFIALAIGMLALFSMTSHLYRVQTAYGPLRYAPMAVDTTVCFILVSLFVLSANPGKGIMQGFTCNCTGGHMARKLMPLVLLLPVILGYLRLTGYWKGRFSGEFLAAAIVCNIVFIFFNMVWYNAYLLNKRDAQKRMSEALLLASENQYHLLVTSVKDYAIFMLDPAGYVVSWNEGAERIKGYTEKEIIGKHMSIFYTEEEILAEEPEKNLARAAQDARFEIQGWRVRKNGDLFLADMSFTALYDPQRKLVGFTKVTRDITERKKLEQRLEQFSSDLEVQVELKTIELIRIFERINDAFIATDENLCYTYLNKKAGELIHLDPTRVIGKSVWDIFPDAIGSAVYHAFSKAMNDQRNSTLTTYSPLPDQWLDYHLYPSPEGLSVFIRDITEQKKSGKEITDYKHALDQSSVISVTDQNGIIKHVNENFCKNSKFTESELVGQDHRIINSGYHPSIHGRPSIRHWGRKDLERRDLQQSQGWRPLLARYHYHSFP